MRGKKDLPCFQPHWKQKPFDKSSRKLPVSRQSQVSLKILSDVSSRLTIGVLNGTSVYNSGLFHALRGFWHFHSLLIMYEQHALNTMTIKYTSMHFKTFLSKQYPRMTTFSNFEQEVKRMSEVYKCKHCVPNTVSTKRYKIKDITVHD